MLRNYLTLAWKVLWRRKFFTFVSLFGIVLTLTVLTVVAGLLDHLFGSHPPEVHAHRTLGIYEVELMGDRSHTRDEAGYAFLDRHIRDLESAEAVTVASTAQETAAYVAGEKVPLRLKRTDGVFWRVLRFEFLEGGPFTETDDAEARHVMVISREARRRLFGAEPAVGRRLEVAGQRFEVVGVVENIPHLRPFAAADLWAPISTFPSSAYRHQLSGGFQARILAPTRADLPAVRAEVRSRLREVDLGSENLEVIASAAETPFEFIARDLLTRGQFGARDRSDGAGENGDPTVLLRLLIALGILLFMALPSLNLINLSISRILERSAEIGVRKSFGASSLSLVGQFVTENLVLTFLGGLLALPIAASISSLIDRTALVGYAPITLGLEAYAAGLFLAAVFGLISGAYPAWRMSRLHPTEALKENLR